MNSKMKKILCIIGAVFICFTVSNAKAEKDTINERLIRVEETVKSLDIRLTQRIDDTNQRIDELKQDINRRFVETNQKIDKTNERIDALKQDINRRFDESNQAINRRFDESNQAISRRFDESSRRFDESNQAISRRFDDSSQDIDNVRALMYVILAGLFSILAMICSLIVYIVKKDRKETNQSHLQNEIIPDLKIIVQKVDTLENDFKEKVIPLWEHYNNHVTQEPQLKYASL
jgi:exonuclease VII large subunit